MSFGHLKVIRFNIILRPVYFKKLVVFYNKDAHKK